MLPLASRRKRDITRDISTDTALTRAHISPKPETASLHGSSLHPMIGIQKPFLSFREGVSF
jgi:hypothetical protein